MAGNGLRADELRPNERVRAARGVAEIVAVESRAEPAPVYNLEVQGTHVYQVAASGVLVHNGTACNANSALSTAANHGYIMYDEVTGKILKFGISSQPDSKLGNSYRVTQQLPGLRGKGYSPAGAIIDYFPDRMSALAWEKAASNAVRKRLDGILWEQQIP